MTIAPYTHHTHHPPNHKGCPMTADQFRREFEKWLNLLHFARTRNDDGGVARCERELTRLSEAGAAGITAAGGQ